MSEFYNTISFKHGEKFKSDKFRSLFHENALLIETYNNQIITKNVEEHIIEFEEAIEAHPELFINGFTEKQLDYKILDDNTYTVVKSSYIKTYTRKNKLYKEEGTSIFTLIRTENSYNILSVAW